MAESSRLAREYKRLVTNMNVPLIDENFYVLSLWNRECLTILDLALLTNKLAKQSVLILYLAHLTTQITKQSNPILDLAQQAK